MGRKVICYFSAGSYENWRSDKGDFPSDVLGNNLEHWEGEKWLDIRDSRFNSIVDIVMFGALSRQSAQNVCNSQIRLHVLQLKLD